VSAPRPLPETRTAMTTPDPAAALPRKPRRLVWRVFGWARNGLAVVGLFSIVYVLCFDLSMIVSGSMAPTLRGEGQPGSDWVLSEKVSYWLRRPRRWEVAWLETADHLMVAKRVVGLPGERVSLRGRTLCINGAPIPFPSGLGFLKYLPFGNLYGGKEVPCGEGYYYFGDDSRDSQDSRFDGPILRNRIHGRAWLVVWPPGRVGFVNP
jgi:signal peptidase I